jgi:hypothetical protein
MSTSRVIRNLRNARFSRWRSFVHVFGVLLHLSQATVVRREEPSIMLAE